MFRGIGSYSGNRAALAPGLYADAYLTAQVIASGPTDSGGGVYQYTFSDVSIGAADTRRRIILAFRTNGPAGSASLHSTLTANAGAISFSQIAMTNGTAAINNASIYEAAVPTGTTLTAPILTVTGNAVEESTIARIVMHGWAHGRGAATASIANASDPCTGTINIPASGLVVAVATATDNNPISADWTSLAVTEHFDDLINSALRGATMSYLATVAETGTTIAPNFTGGAGGGNERLVAAAFGMQLA